MRLSTPCMIVHSQEIKLVSPVYVGDRIRWEGTVEDVSSAVRVVVIKFRLQNQAGRLVSRGRFQVGVLP